MSEYELVQNKLDEWIYQEKSLIHKIEMACKWLNDHDAEYAKLSTREIIKDISRPSVKPPKTKQKRRRNRK